MYEEFGTGKPDTFMDKLEEVNTIRVLLEGKRQKGQGNLVEKRI